MFDLGKAHTFTTGISYRELNLPTSLREPTTLSARNHRRDRARRTTDSPLAPFDDWVRTVVDVGATAHYPDDLDAMPPFLGGSAGERVAQDAAHREVDGREIDADDGRDESEMERLDRNTVELLNELRVASVGIQVLFAFLLIVRFNTGFKQVTSFDRYDYFVTLLCIASAAALLIAPSIHHRLLFRRRQKAYLVRVGTQLTIAGMVFLTVGLTGILVLISHVMFGATTTIVVGTLAALLVSTLWFAVPLRRRRKVDQFHGKELG